VHRIKQNTTNTNENIKGKKQNRTELKEEHEPVGDSQFSFFFSFFWFLLDS